MSRTAALALAAKGFKVFPIKHGAKFPPLWKNWPDRATTIVPEDWPEKANVGIHCAGLLVIDVDIKKGGPNALALLRLTEELPDTLTTITSTGGSHLFYRLPEGHGGVPNSVGTLGAGLDIRSTGGYVVGPGSEVPAGVYAFEDPDLGIADAPGWLVARLGMATAKPASDVERTVHDAAPDVVERASLWLADQPGAAEGQGGDARTFAVACGLRDYGVSAAQALGLMAEWNSTCSPPWGLAELEIKVANAYRYAENPAGSRAALPDDFPEVAPQVTPAVKAGPLLSLSQFANSERKGAGYVVKGLLQRGSYACAYGAPGEGKTFVALDVAYHVAAGALWMDRKVHAGPVLYLAYEGTGGLVKRAQALRQHYGAADVPLYIASAAYDLRQKQGRADVGGLLAALPAPPVLIVVDTFARALMGGDENSAQDVGTFNGAVAALIESTGACVLIVHHSGKDKSRGARGSSALLGALDTEIEIDGGRITAQKQRDVEAGAPIGFKLVPLVVGIDEDGDESTSCVVLPDAVAENPLGRISGNVKRGFEVLCALRPDNKPIDIAEWRTGCLEFLGKNAASQRFFDLKRALAAKGYIEVNPQGLVTRRMT